VPLRLALTVTDHCRHLLYYRDQVARALTFFDRWVVLLPPGPDDGSAILFQDLQRRYPSRVSVSQWPLRWRDVREAWRSACVDLRPELDSYPDAVYVWRWEPSEVWEASALLGAERELDHRRGRCGSFRPVPYVGVRLRVTGGPDQHYHPRLWRWDGRLLDPEQTTGVVRLAPRYEDHGLAFPFDVARRAELADDPYLPERWRRLQERGAREFPVPLTELYPDHHYQPQPLIHHEDEPPTLPS
jgi:hypothetical protein